MKPQQHQISKHTYILTGLYVAYTFLLLFVVFDRISEITHYSNTSITVPWLIVTIYWLSCLFPGKKP